VTKEDILRIEQEKKRVKEEKMKKEIDELKKRAREKDKLRKKRLKSILIIQKWTRGHFERKRF
jgi:hypothetical protein